MQASKARRSEVHAPVKERANDVVTALPAASVAVSVTVTVLLPTSLQVPRTAASPGAPGVNTRPSVPCEPPVVTASVPVTRRLCVGVMASAKTLSGTRCTKARPATYAAALGATSTVGAWSMKVMVKEVCTLLPASSVHVSSTRSTELPTSVQVPDTDAAPGAPRVKRRPGRPPSWRKVTTAVVPLTSSCGTSVTWSMNVLAGTVNANGSPATACMLGTGVATSGGSSAARAA